jgi:head-tail adaptor
LRARGFSKRVELWQVVEAADGFGGYTMTEQLITRTWASVRSLSGRAYKDLLTDFGVNVANLAVTITLRFRNDLNYTNLNQFIKYNGDKYIILSFPEDKNFDHRFITFIAYKEPDKTANILEPLDEVGSIFDAYSERVTDAGATLCTGGCQKNFINDLISG